MAEYYENPSKGNSLSNETMEPLTNKFPNDSDENVFFQLDLEEI